MVSMVKKKRDNVEKKHSFFLSILLFISTSICLFFLTHGITLPFVGYNAWNFNTYSLIAHNYNQFGFFATKFAPVISVSEVLPQNPQYYLHHPMLLSIIQAIFFRILGESFLVGRLPVIIFTFSSLVFFYLIGKELWGNRTGVIAVIIASMLPGTIIFGRMIGQEALVLFFVLFTLYFVLQYIKTRSKKDYIFSFIGVVLGVLSDWPMIYFVFCLSIWLIHKKEKKLSVILTVTSTIVGVLYLLYIYLLQGSFSELLSAIRIRSIGELVTISYWPLKWIVAILLRIFFYFNPLIVFLSFIVFIVYYLKKRVYTDNYLLLIGFGLFGVIHIVLYPDGSFGHPYWIIYLLPFFVFSSSLACAYLLNKKHYLLISIVFVSSVMYLWKVENWKTKEIQGNVWRYEMAKQMSPHLPKYSSTGIHDSLPIDHDLLRYKFLVMTYPLEAKEISSVTDLKFYICTTVCETEEIHNRYSYNTVNTKWGRVYIYDLEKKVNSMSSPSARVSQINTFSPRKDNSSLQKSMYIKIQQLLEIPQL